MAIQTLEFSNGIFEMYDPEGANIGGATDVEGSISIDITTGQGSANFSSETPFYGYLWTAHDIVVQMIAEDAMEVNMLFDWGGERNISVTVYMGITLNADDSVKFTTLDTDGDGILGYPMDSGIFTDFSAAFSGLATPINVAPVATNDVVTTNEDITVTIDVLANDTDIDGETLTVTSATATNGTVAINIDGTLTYQGNQDFKGVDTITYTITDYAGLTSTAIVTVDVTAANDDPVANDDAISIGEEEAAVVINVLDNDVDVDGDRLSVIDAVATNGIVTINADGTLEYTANQKFNGVDIITYTISDGNGAKDTATVEVVVKTEDFVEDDDDSYEDGLEDGETENWHEVDLVAGEKYVFRLEESNVGVGKLKDAYIELRDESGELVDKYSGLSDSIVALEATRSGKYYLVIKSYDDQDTGDYKIITRRSDDHGGTSEDSTIASFIANEVPTDTVTVTGGIQWEDRELDDVPEELKDVIPDRDEDWFSFELSTDDAKQFITFDLEATSTGKKLKDATIEIFDPDNNLVARASGEDLDDSSASITLKVLSTGNYTVRVTDSRGSTGDYQLTATKTTAPDDEDTDTDVEFDFEKSVTVDAPVIDVDAHAKGSLVFTDVTRSITISTTESRDKGTFSIDKDTEEYEFIPNEALKNSIILGDKTIDVSVVDALDLYIPNSSYEYTPVDKISSEYFEVELDDGSVEIVRVEIKDVENISHSVKNDEVIKVGNIGIAGDIDTHKVPIIKANSYFVEVVSVADGITAPLKKAELILKWGDGVQDPVEIVQSNLSNNIVSIMPSAIFEAEDDGFVYIEVKAKKLSDVGQYAVRVIDLGTDGGDDAIDQIADYDSLSITSMSVGDNQYGTLENADDVDIIAVNLIAGQKTTIEVTSKGSLTTTHVVLLNSAGEVIASAKSGRDLVAQINAQVADTDVYFIKVNNAHVENNKGDYLINVIDQTNISSTDWVVSSSFALGEGEATSQWYVGVDALNIESLDGEFTGAGVTISVVDSGVDYNHSAFNDPSFTTNSGLNAWAKYQNDTTGATYNENTGQYDVGGYEQQLNHPEHGTLVSGIIAGDSQYGTLENTDNVNFLGLSPDAEIHSWYRANSANTIATAYAFDPNHYETDGTFDWQNPALVNISNNSWNYSTPFSDNFLENDTEFSALRDAIQLATDSGVIFVFSAGNGGATGDNVNYHNLTNSPLTIAVASVDQDNLSSTWSTPGSAILVAAYGDNIYTTDLEELHSGGTADPAYVASSGTSFAAPEVSAIIALMLEANPLLGYRDVQAILAHSAIKTEHENLDYWKVNQNDNHNLGGMHFNDDMGFGIVNPYSAVRLAETWKNNDTYATTTNNESNKYNVTSGEISYGSIYADTVNIISDTTLISKTLSVGDIKVEHVVLKVDLDHPNLTQLTIEITSPGADGSTSTLMSGPTNFSSSATPNLVFEFSSVQFYGENGGGEWTVTVTDDTLGSDGALNSLELTVYGSNIDDNDQYIFTDEFVSPVSVVYDNVGTDWINTAAVTSDVDVDLTALTMSYATVIPDIAGLTKVANIVTGDGNDTLTGSNAVNNILDGGRGSDTVIYTDLLDLDVNYSVDFTNSNYVLVTNLSTLVQDTLYSIDKLSFGGELYSISTTGFINKNATIQTDLDNFLDNVTLNYYKNGVDTGVSTLVENGDIIFDQSVDFDVVKLADLSAYNVEIDVSDSVGILMHYAFPDTYLLAPNSSDFHAGDVNNDGSANVADSVAILRHYAFPDSDLIDTFDLINNLTGERITYLDMNATEIGQWSIVPNGDTNQDGFWVEGYTAPIDIV